MYRARNNQPPPRGVGRNGRVPQIERLRDEVDQATCQRDELEPDVEQCEKEVKRLEEEVNELQKVAEEAETAAEKLQGEMQSHCSESCNEYSLSYNNLDGA